MLRKLKKQKGFTLIELMIAMAIFITFTGILINSYTDIVLSQRDANEYRLVYSESRRVFEKFIDEVRNGVIYFDDNESFNTALEEVTLVAKDGVRVVNFAKDGDAVNFTESTGCAAIPSTFALNSNGVKVTELSFYISPAFDPYHPDNVVYNSLQFQPKITIFATFERERSGGREPYSLDLQTTVSSRFYSFVPSVNKTCLINK